jgi:hypothetical protein
MSAMIRPRTYDSGSWRLTHEIYLILASPHEHFARSVGHHTSLKLPHYERSRIWSAKAFGFTALITRSNLFLFGIAPGARPA